MVSWIVNRIRRVIEGWGKNREGTYMQQIQSLKMSREDGPRHGVSDQSCTASRAWVRVNLRSTVD